MECVYVMEPKGISGEGEHEIFHSKVRIFFTGAEDSRLKVADTILNCKSLY
jgi:hypothetical protein